ncbi:ABC transporter ATP-binding protein [Corynebacterium sp. HS2168-gen11]|uniref:ATP-binding cassette domain-containing protein n=1 Tax=Corynebacterium sp. HS2168-gen11 TaxID=2974027 RepID=UPI00216AEE51|nr:ABC transporter ATP-binding protein [Corynebacterium sp. HS2168-gen11]MCS4535377.1 ABC transporter ATP-binding protein [Corynebacterium sp. HS2168-gen11]
MLEIKGLNTLNIVRDVSFTLQAGSRVGLIGESGSGKTLTALSIMRLVDATGEITLDDLAIHQLTETGMCQVRGKRISMVFQEPMSALNPLMKIGAQLREAIRIHRPMSKRAANTEMLELLDDVELDASLATRYPHELSGGQRQRVLIAMALAHQPDILICDEPTTALDVTSQRAVLDLILTLVARHGTALLFITHDLGLIAQACEEVLVMQNGAIVESGTVEQVLQHPKHPYTQMLLDASDLPAASPARQTDEVLVSVDHVWKRYNRHTSVLRGINLSITRGQRLGIVGGSGSGKTTLLKLLAGLEKPSKGKVHVHGDLHMVFQDPMGSLNPRMRVGDIIAETLASYDSARIAEVLTEVGLVPEMANRFPHEFSGGQRQRISLARALAPYPELLLADEPVSALDVSVRKKVLTLLDSLVQKRDLTLVFVSHDIHVVRSVCTDVIVMQDGEIIESGTVAEVLDNPQTQYTKDLIAAVPKLYRN